MPFKLSQMMPIFFVWLWSTGFIGAKYGLPYIEPFFMLFIRFLLVIPIFYVLMLSYKSPWLTPIKMRQQIVIGMLIHGLYLSGIFFAIKEGMPAGVAAIIVGLQPILSTFISYKFLKQTINKKQLLGLITGFIGVSLVIFEKSVIDTSQISFLGLMMCFIALFSISFATMLQKQQADDTPLISGSFFQYIGALIVAFLLTINFESQEYELTLPLVGAIAWLVIALSIIAVMLLLYMIRQGEVAKVTSYFYLVPPVAVIQSWLIFDEMMGIIAIFGIALTVIGVWLVVKGKY